MKYEYNVKGEEAAKGWAVLFFALDSFFRPNRSPKLNHRADGKGKTHTRSIFFS